MIVNGDWLYEKAPIKDMLYQKKREHGVSYGLTEAGYDIRVKQDIRFVPPSDTVPQWGTFTKWYEDGVKMGRCYEGKFALASAIEEFNMPTNLVGVVHDKSTWARKGLSVFNTVIEPGWKGFLTLELVYHGNDQLHIPAGSGIAQVLFSEIAQHNTYDGKYQNQSDMPVEAKFE